MNQKLLMLIIISSVTLFSASFAEEDSEASTNKDVEKKNDLRESRQNWREVDYILPFQAHEPPSLSSSGWIPREQPKRRRLRKRKRRPDEHHPQTRPQFLEENEKESFAEMVHEMNPQPYHSRRRISPVYEEPIEKIRDPFTALIEAEEKQKMVISSTTSTPDLKAILKQSGGLSLSEILQQKNLTLAELLMGKQEAILALTEKSVTDKNDNNMDKRMYEESTEDSNYSSEEIMKIPRDNNYKDTKIFAGVAKFDVVTEATTEKRIFVPSNSNYYTSINYRNSFGDFKTETPETTTVKVTAIKSKPNLPMTSAKLNKLKNSRAHPAALPENAITISINEIFGFTTKIPEKITTITTTTPKEVDDGPFKMTLDLEEFLNIPIETTTKQPETTTTQKIAEKLKEVTAKDEISEILQNPSDRRYLSDILRRRNMTVEQLVEQRERGSSQLHLADIFHNKTREPEPQDEPAIGVIKSDYFATRQEKSRKNVNTAPPSTTTTTIKPTPVMTEPQELYTITSFPTYKIESNRNVKKDKAVPQPFLPLWDELYPSFFPEASDENHNRQQIRDERTTINYDDLKRLEDVENRLVEIGNDRLNVDLIEDDERHFINLPSGVKSAIFASLAIIGLSLVVFLTILVIFKYMQWQKRRLNYNGSFSGSKIKSPILESERNKRSFRSFMTETLGRKKNYYKTHMQSMSDNIWESDKKSYMI